MRFGIEPYLREHTVDEIGAEMGVTKQRISPVIKKAVEKLRHPLRIKKLKKIIGEKDNDQRK